MHSTCLGRQNTGKVFVCRTILFGIPYRIRSDSGTSFKSHESNEFCRNRLQELVECPVGKQLGKKSNGMFQQIQKALTRIKESWLERNNMGCTENWFALRSAEQINQKAETAKKVRTMVNLMGEKTSKPNNSLFLHADANLQLHVHDVPHDVHSTLTLGKSVKNGDSFQKAGKMSSVGVAANDYIVPTSNVHYQGAVPV